MSGRLVGLFVGISQYPPGCGFAPLPEAARDAMRVYSRCQVSLGLDVAESVLLADYEPGRRPPTVESITDSLDVLTQAEIGQEDTLIIWYSGHGFCDGQETYLLPSGVEGHSAAHFKNTALSLKGIAEYLNIIPARSQILVLDCCRTPLGLKPRGMDVSPMARPLGRGTVQAVSRDTEPSRTKTRSSRVIMLACDEGEYSYESHAIGGHFTRTILSQLSRFPVGPVSVAELFDRTQSELASSGLAAQTPQMIMHGSFVPHLSIHRAHPSPDPKDADRSDAIEPRASSSIRSTVENRPDYAFEVAEHFALHDIGSLTFLDASKVCERLMSYSGPRMALCQGLLGLLMESAYRRYSRPIPSRLRDAIEKRHRPHPDDSHLLDAVTRRSSGHAPAR